MHILENFVNQQLILHYTLVIGCCTTLHKIFDTISADTGLSMGRKEDVHYVDAKEHQSPFVKNVRFTASRLFLIIPYSLNIVNMNVYTTVFA